MDKKSANKHQCLNITFNNHHKIYLATEEFTNELLNFKNSRRSANEYDLVNIILLKISIFQNLLNWLNGRTEEILNMKMETMHSN